MFFSALIIHLIYHYIPISGFTNEKWRKERWAVKYKMENGRMKQQLFFKYRCWAKRTEGNYLPAYQSVTLITGPCFLTQQSYIL